MLSLRIVIAGLALLLASAVIAGEKVPPPPEAPADPMPVPPAEVEAVPLPKIDPKTPVKDLLPAAPAFKKAAYYVGDDLSRVPELGLEAAPPKDVTTEKWKERRAFNIAAALHLNSKDEDGYLKAALKGRDDLAGVPFVMGGACRTKGQARAAFKEMASAFRGLAPDRGGAPKDAPVAEPAAAGARRAARAFHRALDLSDELELAVGDSGLEEGLLHAAAVKAVAQISGGQEADHRLVAVKRLAGVSRVEATRELARMAVFSLDKGVRDAAVKALSVRRERDYTATLVEALRYPWPQVARNAADAIVKLERADLMPKLVDMLDAPDARTPTEDGGKPVARELVKINHHKNCMMCHPPVEAAKVPEDVLTAEVPAPTEKLPPPEQGYGQQQSNLLVRIDVTYLRQDFSALQEVDDADPWPTMQRFDFVVRKRTLTAEEAADLKKRLQTREPGVLSPYQKAAVEALRKMTGRDFEAKPAAWRKFLKLESS